MRVRVNAKYRYNPRGWDVVRPCQGNTLTPGQVIKVINLPSAPPANTMGHCYVADIATGKFLCMVSTSSLEAVSGRKAKQAKRKTRRFMPREYGIGDFLAHMHGLTKAARKVQKEEQLMLQFDPVGKLVN